MSRMPRVVPAFSTDSPTRPWPVPLDLDPLNPRTQNHFLGYIQIISDVCPDVFQNITWHDETRQSSWRSPSQKALRIPQRDKNSKIVRFSHFAENYEVVHPTKPNFKLPIEGILHKSRWARKGRCLMGLWRDKWIFRSSFVAAMLHSNLWICSCNLCNQSMCIVAMFLVACKNRNKC